MQTLRSSESEILERGLLSTYWRLIDLAGTYTWVASTRMHASMAGWMDG